MRPINRPVCVTLLATVVAFTWLACARSDSDVSLSGTLRLATTTSCENSGLLTYLLPHFKERTGIHVDVIAVGSGRALRLAENGDVDVVLVHSPVDEAVFVERGYGVNRRRVMFNEFVVVGPPSDPAGIADQTGAVEALRQVSNSGAVFVSRGDDSGTHRKEVDLWERADMRPESGPQYREAGQGMADTLRVAEELQGYTLTDIATFLTHGQELDLEILVQGDAQLRNPYHVIAVNPDRHEHTRYLEAMVFVAWLTSQQGAELIAAFSHEGRQLFTPEH